MQPLRVVGRSPIGTSFLKIGKLVFESNKNTKTRSIHFHAEAKLRFANISENTLEHPVTNLCTKIGNRE